MNIGYKNISSGSINGLVSINANDITADNITTELINLKSLYVTTITATDIEVKNILKTKGYANIDTEIGDLKSKTSSISGVAFGDTYFLNNIICGAGNVTCLNGNLSLATTNASTCLTRTQHQSSATGYTLFSGNLQATGEVKSIYSNVTCLNGNLQTATSNASSAISRTQYQSASLGNTTFTGNVLCDSGNLQTATSNASSALSIANTASSDASTCLTRTQYQSSSASNTAFSSTITCNNLTTSSYNVNTELLNNRNDRITNWIYDSIRNIVFFYTRFDLPKMYLVAGESTERMIGASVTLTNTALETCSRGKPAWRVTAIDGHVQLGGGLTVTSTSETWSLVVAFGNINRAQMDDASDKNYVLFMQTYGWSNVNSNLNHCISYNPKLLRLYFEETNGSSTYQSMDIDDFANKLVCFCHDNTNMYVYVEGVLTYTVSNPNPYTGTQCNYITLLNRNSTNLRPLEHVQLCAVSLYDYTLTQSLIDKIHWDDIVI